MPRFEIRVSAGFEAAHHLRSYRGAPEPAHGHSWRVEACVVCDGLNDEGYGVDFVELRAALEALAGRLNHGDINRIPPFDEITPSAEHIARWFWQELEPGIPEGRLDSVTVQEAPGCSVTYRP